jgi:hypothetical protein
MTSAAVIAASSCTVGGLAAVLATRLGAKKCKPKLSHAARPNVSANAARQTPKGDDHDAHD